MPLYAYECKACGTRFERQQHFIDDPVKTCPECGGEVHRLIHPVAIIFKGSGFYITDNRKARSCSVVPTAKKESKTAKTAETTRKRRRIAKSRQ